MEYIPFAPEMAVCDVSSIVTIAPSIGLKVIKSIIVPAIDPVGNFCKSEKSTKVISPSKTS